MLLPSTITTGVCFYLYLVLCWSSDLTFPQGGRLVWESHIANEQADTECIKALQALEKQGKCLCLLLGRSTLHLYTESQLEMSYEISAQPRKG